MATPSADAALVLDGAADERSLALRQQRLDELNGASLRALAGEVDLHYRGARLFQGEHWLKPRAPHLQVAEQSPDLADPLTRRALADALAQQLRHTDSVLHQQLAPKPLVERLIFDLLEQLRAESQVPPWQPGVIHNLRRRFERWSWQFMQSGHCETAAGLFVFAISQIAWTRISGHLLDQDAADLIESTRADLTPVIGIALAGLRRDRDDQRAFAQHALSIAAEMARRIRDASPAPDERQEQEIDATLRAAFSIELDIEQESEESLPDSATGLSKSFEASGQQYRIFSTQYDREDAITDLVRPAQLKDFRARLDPLLEGQQLHLKRLARQLQLVLARPEQEGWNFGEEEGLIDGRRLSLLLSTPGERRLFRQPRQVLRNDTVFSILLDCSGSMKAHVDTIAPLVDMLSRALEMAGGRSEVLGFTTAAWSGGRARKQWLAQGQPALPGRLNERQHLVFKSAETPWRHARNSIAGLFKSDLFREGLDGEAVEWACSRLIGCEAQRRLLLVISDGCPMDSATTQANDAWYLDNHLKQVVARQERLGAVQIMGLGVGLDLGVYYRHCLGIDARRRIDMRMLDDLVALIARRHHR